MSRKVCVVITARPSYSRIASAMAAIRDHPELDLQLVVAASALLGRYGEVVKQIEADGFAVDRRVYMVLEGENLTSMAKTTGIGIVELATAFESLRPDVVVSVADRFETMATAVSAAYMNIPLAHVQGGEVTGSIDERVRHAVTKLADLHFPATHLARDRIIKMGEKPDTVFVTGCPSIDLAAAAVRSETLGPVFDTFRVGVGEVIDFSEPYVIVMQHPVTDEYGQARVQVTEVLEAIHSLGVQAIWFWPNVDAGSDGTSAGMRSFREGNPRARIHFVKNLPPADFIRLLNAAAAIIGNSSVAIREGEFLGVPAVNIGTRQMGREHGINVVNVGYDRTEIREATEWQIRIGKYAGGSLYGDGRAGARIADLLASQPLHVNKRLNY